jgi:predicted nucleic acid-binding protein
MLYLDTSLLVAVLTHEARTGEMQEWLAAQAVDELIVSDWVVTEFSSALSVKVRTAQLSPAHRAEALALFTSLVDASLTVLPVTRLDFRTAARFADQHETGLRAGDALHLAICANHGPRLQSLDGRLVRAAEALGIDARLL